jgi:hypothetical protein
LGLFLDDLDVLGQIIFFLAQVDRRCSNWLLHFYLLIETRLFGVFGEFIDSIVEEKIGGILQVMQVDDRGVQVELIVLVVRFSLHSPALLLK